MRMSEPKMKQKKPARRTAPVVATEPVGIVISRGREAESAPRFSAYMYAPVPDDAAVPARLATT
jgi:hypothetical protein